MFYLMRHYDFLSQLNIVGILKKKSYLISDYFWPFKETNWTKYGILIPNGLHEY